MDDLTCAALARLNQAFYDGFADEFAGTRQGLLPGFDLILPHVAPASNVLDLGCGNGRFLRFLGDRGWQGRYTGVDSSERLLQLAAGAAAACVGINARFVQGDLMQDDWSAALALTPAEAVISLAVLHHIPGRQYRRAFLTRCRRMATATGVVILSTWQFMASPRLRARILPWSVVGLRDEHLEPHDYLLGWGQGDRGRRYCAWIGPEELDRLAGEAGLNPMAHYRGDGREGNLNLYGVYRPQ